MICECCGKTMLEGYIPSTGLWWISKTGEHGIWKKRFRAEDYPLGSLETKDVESKPAYYCMHCDRIVIDCKEPVE